VAVAADRDLHARPVGPDAAHEAAHVIQQKVGAAKDEPDYLDEDSDDDGVLDVD